MQALLTTFTTLPSSLLPSLNFSASLKGINQKRGGGYKLNGRRLKNNHK